jgi:hypothetical protein
VEPELRAAEYGWYGNVNRGKRRKAQGEEPPSIEEFSEVAPSKAKRAWGPLIRMVYEVEPLLCPQCGETMKAIAAIEPGCADTGLRHERDRQAQTGDLPIPDSACLPVGRCSYGRGRWTGPSSLAPPSLGSGRTRKISLDSNGVLAAIRHCG